MLAHMQIRHTKCPREEQTPNSVMHALNVRPYPSLASSTALMEMRDQAAVRSRKAM